MTEEPPSHEPLQDKEFDDFLKFFSNTTERGAALSVTADLDSAIGDCLKKVMIRDDQAVNQMFSEQGQLHAFGAKVRFCYLFGFIRKETYNELVVINKVRNNFAHTKAADDFTFPKIQGNVSRLLLLRDYDAFAKYYAFAFHPGVLPERFIHWEQTIEILQKEGINLKKANWAFLFETAVLTKCFERTASQYYPVMPVRFFC